eukprot:CAMPEP_0194545660 /NCGR_PEP_ID=MMETSP0253-20130528/89536_1 /TAXON_ID=2966 /ORGANISM="Noctiluca scintillans" /LENGTH=68 /DNA_ID=CAMNT_0039392677 /DNA_START=155 /DNA_END=361 /DNA_ORIENTATION=+
MASSLLPSVVESSCPGALGSQRSNSMDWLGSSVASGRPVFLGIVIFELARAFGEADLLVLAFPDAAKL